MPGAHDFAAVGELALKGLPEPTPAWEVRWRPLDREHGAAGVTRASGDLLAAAARG